MGWKGRRNTVLQGIVALNGELNEQRHFYVILVKLHFTPDLGFWHWRPWASLPPPPLCSSGRHGRQEMGRKVWLYVTLPISHQFRLFWGGGRVKNCFAAVCWCQSYVLKEGGKVLLNSWPLLCRPLSERKTGISRRRQSRGQEFKRIPLYLALAAV